MTPLPERPSLPQALGNVHPGRTVAMRVANAASRGLLETPGPTPTRSALNEQDGHTQPLHVPTVAAGADWRPEPFKARPEDGGCVRCQHVEGAHRRGKSTPIRCTATHCDCLGYKSAWTRRDTAGAVVTVVLWLAVAAVVLGVIAIAIGGGS